MRLFFADAINAVLFFSLARPYLPGKVRQHLLWGFRAFRVVKLDPVPAIGFSAIQGVVGKFDKAVDGKGLFPGKRGDPQACSEAEIGKRAAEPCALHGQSDPVCHENRFFQR